MKKLIDQFDLDIEEKDIIGGVDRLLVSIGMAFLAIIPTYFYLIFKPKIMSYMLRGEEEDGRQGLKLGPGITFVFTTLALLAIGYIFRDVMTPPVAEGSDEAVRKGIRAAVAEGNFWRAIVLSLPLYLSAVFFGALFHMTHRLFKKTTNLTLSVGVGLYVLSTLLILIVPVVGLIETIDTSEDSPLVIIPVIIAFFIVLPWQCYSFSRHAFGNPKGSAAIIALLCFFLTMLSITMFGVLSVNVK